MLTRLVDGQQFVLLKPLDLTEDSANEFPCDQPNTGLNTKIFKVPEEPEADHYIVQLSWTNDGGRFYSCGDISITKREVVNEPESSFSINYR